MIKRAAIYELIKGAAQVPVYPDYIPQDVSLPAVAYTLVSAPDGLRTLEGGVTLQQHFWQLEILVNDRQEGDAIGERIRQLDGLQTDDFQHIEVAEPRDSPSSPDVTTKQSIVEIQTTNRRNRA
ncbi:hypothetical protein [Aeromonas caviae]|uniref:hypothetical protein n=1 Tax=Aeromonas caviae TaxID=648 RepID=UPI002B45E4D1|nr:hypothetical protein [Aeromonas caviae]